MATNDYHFITHWRLRGDVEEVYRVLGAGDDLARWWPSVYLGVEQLAPGDANGVGRRINLYTKGWVPYHLHWRFEVTEAVFPRTFRLVAHGDFEGRGVWTFEQDGPWVNIVYDWQIRADKPLLHYLSFVMKPIFSANHHWAMAQGEESLRLELARRHAATPADRARIPAPPRAVPDWPFALALGALAIPGAGLVLRRARGS